MADNTVLSVGAGGDTIATDDIAGVKHQRVKIEYGADGSATDVSDANPLPVDDAGGSLTVDDGGSSLTVDGAVTVSGTVTADTELPAAAALADAAGNPTTPTVGAGVLVWNGTGWDRARGDIANGIDVDVTRVQGTVTVAGTVTANLAAGTNNIGDVDVLSLPALPAGTNAIGKLAANSGVDIGDVDVTSLPTLANVTTVATLTALTGGGVAHDAADSGNPVKVGTKSGTADQAAVANADRSDLRSDTLGHLVTRPYALHENLVSGATSAITTTTSTQVIAAAGAGVRNYITTLLVTNSHADVGTLITITDGSGGAVLFAGYAAPVGGGFALTFPTPLRGSANTAIHAVAGTTGANVYVSAAGYKAAV